MIKFWIAWKERECLPKAQKFCTCEEAADFERCLRMNGMTIVKLPSIAEYLIAERR